MSDRTATIFAAAGMAAILAAATSSSARGSSARAPVARFVFDEYKAIGPESSMLLGLIENAARMPGLSWRLLMGMKMPQLLASIGGDPRARLFDFFEDFAASGQQSFVIGPKLQALFRRTSLTGVPGGAVPFPYPAFYVALPDSGLRLWDPSNGWNQVTGVFVRQAPKMGPNVFQFSIWALSPGGPKMAIEHGNDAYVYVDLDEADQHPDGVEGWLDSKLMESMGARDYWKDPRWAGNVIEVSETQRDVFRIVLNMLIYLSSKGADLSSHPYGEQAQAYLQRLMGAQEKLERSRGRERKKARESKRIQDKIATASRASVVWLGRGVEESNAMRATPASRIRHWVRGHWWPRLDNPVAIQRHGGVDWRQPYERNKDARSQVSKRTYHFEEDDVE